MAHAIQRLAYKNTVAPFNCLTETSRGVLRVDQYPLFHYISRLGASISKQPKPSKKVLVLTREKPPLLSSQMTEDHRDLKLCASIVEDELLAMAVRLVISVLHLSQDHTVYRLYTQIILLERRTRSSSSNFRLILANHEA